MANRPRHASGIVDISEAVPSDARGLDEASLRRNLMVTASHPDLLPQAQETRLALSELLLSQGRTIDGAHFYIEATAFLDDDPVRHASKLFWVAELKWRTGNAMGCLDTLKSALAYAEMESVDDKNHGEAERLKQAIEDAWNYKHNLLVLRETSENGRAGRKCPVIHF